MQNDFLSSFLNTFFIQNNCAVDEMEPGVLSVKLTEALDKAFMNRPFYWQYMESTHQQGVPMELICITDAKKREEKGEWIQFGTNRLHQMVAYLKKQAQFTVLFQSVQTNVKTMLQPWLMVNYVVIFTGKQRKEMVFSFGLNLINGVMTLNMMERLEEIPLERTISDQCYTVSPLITVQSGYARIEAFVEQLIKKEDHSWAVESFQLLEEELAMLKHFYQNEKEDYEREMEDIRERLEPTIHIEVINGGMVYLKEHIFSH